MRLAAPILLLFAAGCPKPPVKAVDKDKEVVELPDVPVPGPRTTKEAVAELVANFERVHFDLDRTDLGAEARDALDANAAILAEFPELKVEVQGHADERGTIDYNMALGQRRAAAVVDYLVARGISPSRLPVLSYGEERPLHTGASESVWALNRRAEFRVIEGAPQVAGTTER